MTFSSFPTAPGLEAVRNRLREEIKRHRKNWTSGPTVDTTDLENQLWIDYSTVRKPPAPSLSWRFQRLASTLILRRFSSRRRHHRSERRFRAGPHFDYSTSNKKMDRFASPSLSAAALNQALQQLQDDNPLRADLLLYRYREGISVAELKRFSGLKKSAIYEHLDKARTFLASRVIRDG